MAAGWMAVSSLAVRRSAGVAAQMSLPAREFFAAGKPAKPAAPDANVSFRKVKIKAHKPGDAGMYGFELSGQNFIARNTSLLDLISYAYEVQAKQVAGGPDWMDKDRYDIAATVDENNDPTHQQLRSMMKNLLASRFHLVFHADKQEMPCYFLAVSTNGPKLPPSNTGGTLPGISLRPEPDGLLVTARNATMEDFAIYLQLILLDRPVVDFTRLTGRFDFHFRYMPEGSEYGGHPPALPPGPRGTEPAPTLIAALEEQAGLKLDEERAFIDVIAVDRADKP